MGWRPKNLTDGSAIHDDVAGEIAALSLVTAASSDHVLIEDASDSNNKKRVAASDFLSGGGGGGQLTLLAATGSTIPTSTVTSIPYSSELRDDGNWHDNSTNNSRVTVGATGEYLVQYSAFWDANGTGLRITQLLVNGTGNPVGGQKNASGSANMIQSGGAPLQLTSGDYVELQAFQNSGANRTVDTRLSVLAV